MAHFRPLCENLDPSVAQGVRIGNGARQVPPSGQGRVVLFTSCQNRVIGGATVGRCDAVSSLPGDPPVLSRLTDYPVPNSTTDGWSGAALALSRDGRHAVVQITDHADTTSGYRFELFERALSDAIFAHGFEP